MAKSSIFSWPYPKTRADVVDIVMICLALLFIGLAFTAYRYNSYKDMVLQPGTLEQSASQMSSTATAADLLLKQTLHGGRTIQNYQQAYAGQLSDQAKSTAQFIASRSAEPAFARQAAELAEDSQTLSDTLETISEPVDEATLKQAAQTIADLRKQFSNLEDAL